ncbi:hypothetical protein [Massilia sp. erpn]|uniref:hypothetical protein n=1 Tax=Massilia sp. erpn TaxID=2738142 RepID=UPI002106FA35|nr:hypothetical protein [Massilia sp. erpn]UTY58325.1 hypothetical protein HPQ68_14730 [Massilia sp. erpn]
MKRNYIPEELMENPARTALRQQSIQSLSQALLPYAYDAFKSTVQSLSQTAKASADDLADEVGGLLRSLLADQQEGELDDELRQLRQQLAGELQRPTVEHIAPLDDDAWLRARSQDLAFTMAAFWTDLADDEARRLDDGTHLLAEFRDEYVSTRRRQLELACSRYYLDSQQTYHLLSRLQRLAQARLQPMTPGARSRQSKRELEAARMEQLGNR